MVPDGPLADDFATGKKKLIPILFSHGLTSSRCLHSTYARELASHGYIVLMMDHADGTCCYTEVKQGTTFKPIPFDYSVPYLNYEDMKQKLEIRVPETTKLIDYVSTDKFLQEELHMDNRAKLLLDSLVLAGHSMGGSTALKVANQDRRVKCCLTMDPWLVPLKAEIESGELTNFSQKAIFMINNKTFIRTYDPKWREFNPQAFKNRLLHELIPKSVLREHAILHGAEHIYQIDYIVMLILDFKIGDIFRAKLPPTNFVQLHQLNVWAWL